MRRRERARERAKQAREEEKVRVLKQDNPCALHEYTASTVLSVSVCLSVH